MVGIATPYHQNASRARTKRVRPCLSLFAQELAEELVGSHEATGAHLSFLHRGVNSGHESNLP